jgi:hypothetical protein
MLNKLSEISERKGSKYLDSFLNDELVITEKLDTFRITFEKKDGNLVFYKKDNTLINIVERTLNDVFENALIEIPSLVNEVELPEGFRFGLLYTPVERPLRIPYTNLPRYILTDISEVKNGKITECHDYDEVTQWAGMLCMARPPVIFKGKLSEEQKKKLVSYDAKQYDGDENSFAEMIASTFGSTYSKQDILEGIVIRSGDKLAQVISYEFELLDEAYQKQNASRDFYDIVLLSLNSFMEKYEIPALQSKGDQKYIDIISDVFNQFVESNSINESIEPKYLTPPQFGHVGSLNKKFINNEITLKMLENSLINEALFRVVLSSFRKFKKPYGLLSESIVEKFNSYVRAINNDLNEFVSPPVYETLNESRSQNITVNAVRRRQPNDVDNMRIIAAIQKAFLPVSKAVVRGEKKCAVYLTSYQPFTTAQMRNIQLINQQWNVPVILAAVSYNNKTKGSNFHLSDGTVSAQMRSISNFNKSLIPAWMMLNSWSLTEIFEFCRPTFEPYMIITDSGKKSEMAIQLFFEEEIMGGRINVEPEFNIGEMENNEAVSALRAIEDGNGSMFMELTPPPVHNLYDNIVSEFNVWNGSVLAQFKPNDFNTNKIKA